MLNCWISTKKKRKKQEIETQWDPWYCKMLDAVTEYIDNIDDTGEEDISERDHRIIQALVEFYGFNYTREAPQGLSRKCHTPAFFQANNVAGS